MLPTIHSTCLADFQQRPVRLVDIGASGGMDARWKRMCPWVSLVGFEPDARASVPSTDARHIVLPNALADASGTRPMYLTRKPEGSSLLRPNRALIEQFPHADRLDIMREENVATTTLDVALATVDVSDVDVIKLDVQGSELDVLRGGVNTLEHVWCLEVEVAFQPIYEGQPLFGDIETFLRARGFLLADLQPYYWKREGVAHVGSAGGTLMFSDALFFRSRAAFYADLQTRSADSARQKLLCAAATCIVYGKPDEACALLQDGRTWLSEEMAAPILQGCQRARGRRSARFSRWRARASHTLSRFARFMAPPSWARRGRSFED